MEEETVICNNCKREVPASNMVIHMVRCVRSITCKICNEVLQADKLEEHMAKHTKLEKCKYCQKEFMEKDLEDHIKMCDERMVSCEYCELELRKLDMDEHLAYCGTRTERCDGCKQLIMFKDKKLHLESNHTFIKINDAPEQEQCPDCKNLIAKDNFENHLLTCDQQVVKCEYCDKDIRRSFLETHKNYCGTRTRECPECGEFVMLKYRNLHLESNHTFLKLNDEPGPLPLSSQTRSTPSYRRDTEPMFTPLTRQPRSTTQRIDPEPIPFWAQSKPVSPRKKDSVDFDNFDDIVPKEVTRDIDAITNLFNPSFPQYGRNKRSSGIEPFFTKNLNDSDNSFTTDSSPSPTKVSNRNDHGAIRRAVLPHRVKRKAPLPPNMVTTSSTNTPPGHLTPSAPKIVLKDLASHHASTMVVILI
ncbi:XIAP-associated factor 1-like isoform X2 [Chrysoperla carnea]|uniref:XIAP-associated factor 1-like isoform X2 n=1 Tax=Chrysoperla carnea TaxID=189513 RepID=UPI001D077036|nr:XIAP-associated factor 1-like isoform X2 [Chrysoperla carnea]